MKRAEYSSDNSCDPFSRAEDPNLGLARKGGLSGSCDEVYRRLSLHAGFNPGGRTVVIPEAIGTKSWSMESVPPFVCEVFEVASLVSGLDLFGQNRNTVFVYESGEVLLIDHDDRVHWAKSKIRGRSSWN